MTTPDPASRAAARRAAATRDAALRVIRCALDILHAGQGPGTARRVLRLGPSGPGRSGGAMTAMNWIAENKDMLSIALATLAIALSAWTVYAGRRARRQDAFVRIHELMISAEVQRGRKLLYEGARSGKFPDQGSEDLGLMNRALSLYNTVGMYVRRNVVPEKWVLDTWHHSLRDIKPGYEKFVQHRQAAYHSWRPWVELEDLIGRAERYRTTMRCCDPTDADASARDAGPVRATQNLKAD